MRDDYRMYHHRHPLVVRHPEAPRTHTLYFNDPVAVVRAKLHRFQSFSEDPWTIAHPDFAIFLRTTHMYCVDN